MKRLGILDQFLLPLCRDIETYILLPRLQVQRDGAVDLFEVQHDTISHSRPSTDLSAEALFSDLRTMIDFLSQRLPQSFVVSLAGQLMPHLISRIISTWLASAVPEDLEGMEAFEDTLSLTQAFGEYLDHSSWPGKAGLDEWQNGIPGLWLKKRQDTSLNKVRKLFSKGLEPTEVVERAETQVFSRGDEVFAANSGGDDWNASWSDDEEQTHVATVHDVIVNSHGGFDNEEDTSAWGLDDEQSGANPIRNQGISDVADEDAEAWGWGDENNEDSHVIPSPIAKSSNKETRKNGVSSTPQSGDRQVTLRETYTITSLPREVLSIILHILSDSRALESPENARLSISSTPSSLLSLPGLVLAMYRAGSSTIYNANPSGNMFSYNDSLWLADQIPRLLIPTDLATGMESQSKLAHNANGPALVTALESHAKRAYAKEMESQRTIVTDMLDGAQGFAQCTEHPFNQECEIAISSTIDRLRQLHSEWRAVLSHSALLQSLGSLLSTVCSKIIVDIEDMSDISEPESQQLTAYCSRIATLEDIFTPQHIESTSLPQQETLPLTAVYTPAWLKFQYLANILESSLVDIKYLWTEGELSLEFQTEELVDLIVALFADSTHRRAAVGEIRASKR